MDSSLRDSVERLKKTALQLLFRRSSTAATGRAPGIWREYVEGVDDALAGLQLADGNFHVVEGSVQAGLLVVQQGVELIDAVRVVADLVLDRVDAGRHERVVRAAGQLVEQRIELCGKARVGLERLWTPLASFWKAASSVDWSTSASRRFPP